MGNIRLIIRMWLSQPYTGSGLVDWGLMLLTTLVLMVAVGSAAAPSNKFSITEGQRQALLTASTVGFATKLWRKRRIIDADEHITELEEQRDQKTLNVQKRFNPHKVALEFSIQDDVRLARIAQVLNERGQVRVNAVGMGYKTPAYERFTFQALFVSSSTHSLYDELTIKRLHQALQLPLNTSPDSVNKVRSIIIIDKLPGRNLMAVDVERHDEDPDRYFPGLLAHIGNNLEFLTIPIGFDYATDSMKTVDVEGGDVSNILISGTSGSGKSSWMDAFVKWLVSRYTEQTAAIIAIDLKPGSQSYPSSTFDKDLEKLPHAMLPTITGLEEAYQVLHAVEVLRRCRQGLFNRLYALPKEHPDHITSADIKGYRRKFFDSRPIPHIFVLIDEASHLKVSTSEYKDKSLWDVLGGSIASQCRSAGIHLVLGYQRCSFEEIPLVVRENTSIRICMKSEDEASAAITLGLSNPHSNQESSRIAKMCKQLIGKQDMIILEGGSPLRLQGLKADTPIGDLPIKHKREINLYQEFLGERQDEYDLFPDLDPKLLFPPLKQIEGMWKAKAKLSGSDGGQSNAIGTRTIDTTAQEIYEEDANDIDDDAGKQAAWQEELLDFFIDYCDYVNQAEGKHTVTNYLERLKGGHNSNLDKLDQSIYFGLTENTNILIKMFDDGMGVVDVIEYWWGKGHAKRLDHKRDITSQREKHRLNWIQEAFDWYKSEEQQEGITDG